MPALWLNEIVSLTRARSIVAPAVVVLLVCLRSSPPAALGHDDHGPRDAVVALGLADAQPPAAVAPAAPTQIERVQAAANVFHTLSLAPLANAKLEVPDEWQERIWKGQMRIVPRGRQTFAGIPFYVLPKTENEGLAAVLLVGGRYKEGPSGGGTLTVGRKAPAIYVLHAASYQNLNAGRVMANYTVHYADGSQWQIPVRNKLELADFLDNVNLGEDCVVGWSAKHPLFPNVYTVYVTRQVNPHPEKEIKSIELRPSPGAAVVSVLGITLGENAPALTPLPDVKPFAHPAALGEHSGHLELTVEADDAPTAARVVVAGADGKAYQPLEGLNYRMLSRPQPFFYTAGRVSLAVPAGAVKVGVAKGLEYRPVELTVAVADGQTVRETVALERWIDLPRRGWYSGEMHIHPFDQEPEDTAVCLLGEDLHVGNLLIWGNGFARRYHGDQFFRGRPENWPDASHIAYYNEEFRNNTYGHLCLIDLRSLVYPMGTGSEYASEDYPANAVIMDRTHAQQAFASVAHMSIPPVDYAVPWEVGVDVALGKADSVDIDLHSFDRTRDRSLDLWYRLLNCGYRIPATCGTDSFMNQSWINQPLGHLRTYAHVGTQFSYARWVQAARAGRSFVTTGPALFLTVDGKMPGETITLAPGQTSVQVAAEAQALYPLKRVEIVMNGEVIASATGDVGATTLKIDKTVDIDGSESAWIAARAEGQSSAFFLRNDLLAHTNPVYCKGAAPQTSPEDAQFFIEEIDGLLAWVQTKGIFHEPAHRDEVKTLFHEARALYVKQTQGAEPR